MTSLATRGSALRSSIAGAAGKGREVGTAMIFEVVQIVAMAINFPIVARSFGPSDYGEYTTLYVIAGMAMTWTAGSVGAAVVQLSLQHQRSSSSLLRTARRQVWLTTLPSAIVGTLVAVAIFGPGILVPALIVFGGDLIIGGMATIHTALTFAAKGVAPATRIRVILPAGKAIGVLALFAVDQVSLITVIVANSLAAVVMLVASIVTVRDLADPGRDAGGERPETTNRELLRYSGLYAATISANSVQEGGENVVLAATRPISETGEYQAAYRLAELALLPLRALHTVSVRWFLVPDGRPRAQVVRAARVSLPVIAYGIVCIGAFLLFAPLVTIVVGDEFEEAVTIMRWLSGFPLVRALADIPQHGLIGLDRNKARMWLGLTGAAFSLTCYLILVPRFGWQGAVLGTYLSEVATLTGGWAVLLVCQRRHDARFP
jgi:O-antigen/teichoic acid export membrane protein